MGLRGSPKTGWKRRRTTGSLARHVGAIAIRAWQGATAPPGAQVGVARILGIRWVPYTRSVYFPGGLLESRIPAGHRAWALVQRYFNGTARQ